MTNWNKFNSADASNVEKVAGRLLAWHDQKARTAIILSIALLVIFIAEIINGDIDFAKIFEFFDYLR